MGMAQEAVRYIVAGYTALGFVGSPPPLHRTMSVAAGVEKESGYSDERQVQAILPEGKTPPPRRRVLLRLGDWRLAVS